MRAVGVAFVLAVCVCREALSVQVKVRLKNAFCVLDLSYRLFLIDLLDVRKGHSTCLHLETLDCATPLLSLKPLPERSLQVGDRSFPLEAVRQLKELMDLEDNMNPHLPETTAVCAHPLLPQVFRPVCQGKGAGIIFSRLGKVETNGNKHKKH